MRVHKPKIVPAFHALPTPRVVYEVRMVTGEKCICNDASDAIELLQEQCKHYVKIMQVFANTGEKK